MKKVKRNTVKEVLNFFKTRGMIEDREFKIKIGHRALNFACGWEIGSTYSEVIVPNYLGNEDEFENKLIMFILRYFKNYGIDYEKFMEDNDLDFYEFVFLSFLLHEIGHMNLGYNEYKRYGIMKTSESTREKFKAFRIGTKSARYKDKCNWDKFWKTEIKYRQLKGERYSDKFACDMLKVYGKELADIVRGEAYFEIGEEVANSIQTPFESLVKSVYESFY